MTSSYDEDGNKRPDETGPPTDHKAHERARAELNARLAEGTLPAPVKQDATKPGVIFKMDGTHEWISGEDAEGAYPSPDSLDNSLGLILFQNGPVGEVGVNGIQIDDLIQVCIERLEAFQAGPYANVRNRQTLVALTDALHYQTLRTLERQMRGVEGTSQL